MFNIEWETQFFFVENMEGEAHCLICNKIIAHVTRYSLCRHYESSHNQYDLILGTERSSLLLQKKAEYYLNYFDYINNNNKNNNKSKKPHECPKEKNTIQKEKASYIVSLSLAKQCRPFSDGVFFKELCQNVLECFGEEGRTLCRIIATIPLSKQTIARRTQDISAYIQSCTQKRLSDCKFFSLCLDESTDSNNLCQLVMCVRTINENFEIFEEIVSISSLHGNVKGVTLYEAVNEHVFSIVDKNKLSSICTDGAKVMVGKKNGLVGYLLKNNIKIPTFHCIIHQQTLFSKELNMVGAMDIAIKIINKIKGGHNALNHRKFKQFLKELHAEHGDLLLYTEVRWLSRGKSLKRLFDLRKEIVLFLEQDSSSTSQTLITSLKSPDFLLDLAFLCDFTELLNKLNLSLQGKNRNIFDLLTSIDQFGYKLQILIDQIKKNDSTNMPCTTAIIQEFSNQNKLETYADIVDRVLKNYENRFSDFNIIRNVIELHNNPLYCTLHNQDPEIQEELLKMRSDLSLPIESGINFWTKIDEKIYFNIKTQILKLYSMFGSTYKCEVSFSTLKLVQNKYRNNLSDQHIADLIRIKEYNSDINLDKVMENSLLNICTNCT